MKYKLPDSKQFCGYKGLPFGILDKNTGDVFFMGKDLFSMLFRLDSGIDAEDLPDSENVQNIINEAISAGYIEEIPIDSPQRVPEYIEYSNRYKNSVHWSITGRCNAKCKHCFQSAPDALFGEPTLEQCLDSIRQFKECGIQIIDITGGEPLVRPDFLKIIDAIIDNGLHVGTIYSNGFLVNQKLIDELIKRGIKSSWQISFDGIGCHDWMRGIDGAEEMAINAIKLLIKNGFKVTCAYSLFKESSKVFMESMKLLSSLGVSAVKTGYMQKQGLWLNHLEHDLSNEEELEFYKRTIPQFLKEGRYLSLQCEGFFMAYSDSYLNNEERINDSCMIEPNESDDINKEKYRFFMDREVDEEKILNCDACESLRKNFYVGPSGNVVPCMGLDGTPAVKNLPNMFETPLKDILTESEYINAVNATVKDVIDHNPECGDCEYRFKCCAGCRAMAVGDDGDDYLAMDKRTCMMAKEDWTGQIKSLIID